MNPIHVLPYINGLAVVMLGIGYFRGAAHKARDSATEATISIQSQEIEALKGSNLRISEEASTAKSEVAKLTGIMEQLRRENSDLKSLVMGEQVPGALAEFLKAVHEATLDRIDASEKHVIAMVVALSEDLHTRVEELVTVARTGKPT